MGPIFFGRSYWLAHHIQFIIIFVVEKKVYVKLIVITQHNRHCERAFFATEAISNPAGRWLRFARHDRCRSRDGFASSPRESVRCGRSSLYLDRRWRTDGIIVLPKTNVIGKVHLQYQLADSSNQSSRITCLLNYSMKQLSKDFDDNPRIVLPLIYSNNYTYWILLV